MASVNIAKLRRFIVALGEAVLKYEKYGKNEEERARINIETKTKPESMESRQKASKVNYKGSGELSLREDIRLIRNLIVRLNTKDSEAFKMYANHRLKKILSSNHEKEAREMAEKLINELKNFLVNYSAREKKNLLEKKFKLEEYLLELKEFDKHLKDVKFNSKLTGRDKEKIKLIKKRINKVQKLMLKKIGELNSKKRIAGRKKSTGRKRLRVRKKLRKKHRAKKLSKKKLHKSKVHEKNEQRKSVKKAGRKRATKKAGVKKKTKVKKKTTTKKTIDSLIKG